MPQLRIIALVRLGALEAGRVRIVTEKDEGVEWHESRNILLHPGTGIYIMHERDRRFDSVRFGMEEGEGYWLKVFNSEFVVTEAQLEKLEGRDYVYV